MKLRDEMALSLDGRDGWERAFWLTTLAYAGSIILSLAIAQILLGILVLLYGAALLRGRLRPLLRTPLDLPFAAFIVARLLSVPLSVAPAVSVHALYQEIIFYFIFFLFTHTRVVRDLNDVHLLVKVLLGAAVLAALIGSFKFLMQWEHRASSLTGGYYTLGFFLCTCLPLVLLIGSRPGFYAHRGTWWLVTAILCMGLAFTFNRLHWLGAAFTFLLAGVLRDRRLLLVFALGSIAVIVAVPGVAERFLQLLTLQSNLSDRDILWQGAYELADDRPLFGFGLQTFRLIFPFFERLSDKGISTWHGDYLQVYMESGLLGLGTLLWILATFLWMGIRAGRRRIADPPTQDAILALFVALGLVFVAGGVLDTYGGLLFRLLLAVFALTLQTFSHQRPNT
jgi:O-antigen ligase